MVFQNFLLFPHKTAAENIVFPLRMQRVGRAERDERLAWALKLMRLDGLADRYPNEMSGGQQQRVALARGLISRPALLLLDEPLANLDRELRSEMEVEIRRYQKQLEIPFVYVTHNQEEALTMSDRIAVMRNGAFEQVAAKTEIYTNPATSFVAGFVGHANRFDGSLQAIAGDDRAVQLEGHGAGWCRRRATVSPALWRSSPSNMRIWRSPAATAEAGRRNSTPSPARCATSSSRARPRTTSCCSRTVRRSSSAARRANSICSRARR